MPNRAPRSVILPLLALLAGAACDPSRIAESEDTGLDITWLQQNAVTLRTTDPGGSHPDMPALAAMIGDARIVGLGEATHGTREFFRMKHRILQYLVEEQGFSTFGIEATFAEATRINRYVLTGEGDPAVLLSNLYFWTWNTQEVLDMILWMRAYNADPAHTRKVTFWGFDMQASRVAMDDVTAYLRTVDAAAADSAAAWYACYRVYEDKMTQLPPSYQAAADEVKTRCRRGVLSVDSLMEARAAPFTAITGRPEYLVARRSARVVVQNEHMRSNTSATSTRDRYMAENVAWLAETAAPGTRLVLWAHNVHIARSQPWMGNHLSEQFGEAYRIVGFSFYRGSLNAVTRGVGVRQMVAPPSRRGSYEHEFHRLGLNGFILDLRPVRGGGPEGAHWLRGPRPLRQVGATYDPATDQASFLPTALAAEYDVLIHVDETTASALLPFRFQ